MKNLQLWRSSQRYQPRYDGCLSFDHSATKYFPHVPLTFCRTFLRFQSSPKVSNRIKHRRRVNLPKWRKEIMLEL